jgi:hypothetical protein
MDFNDVMSHLCERWHNLKGATLPKNTVCLFIAFFSIDISTLPSILIPSTLSTAVLFSLLYVKQKKRKKVKNFKRLFGCHHFLLSGAFRSQIKLAYVIEKFNTTSVPLYPCKYLFGILNI